MQAKRWWQSRTILGALAALIATVVRFFIPDTELEAGDFLNMLTQASQLAGTVLAIVGRFQATRRVATKKAIDRMELAEFTAKHDAAHGHALPRADEPRRPPSSRSDF